MGKNCVDYSTLTVTSATQVVSVECNPIQPNRAKGAVMTVENADVRYRLDGTAPTTTEGMLLANGDALEFDSWTVPSQDWRTAMAAMQIIRVSADAKLKIHWFD